jgi:hypothetical protein
LLPDPVFVDHYAPEPPRLIFALSFGLGITLNSLGFNKLAVLARTPMAAVFISSAYLMSVFKELSGILVDPCCLFSATGKGLF